MSSSAWEWHRFGEGAVILAYRGNLSGPRWGMETTFKPNIIVAIRVSSYVLVTTAVLPPNSDNHGFAELLAEERGGGDQRGSEKLHFCHYGSVEIRALSFSLQ